VLRGMDCEARDARCEVRIMRQEVRDVRYGLPGLRGYWVGDKMHGAVKCVTGCGVCDLICLFLITCY